MTGLAWLCVTGVGTVACASPAAPGPSLVQCAPLAPSSLPSGAAIGAPRVETVSGVVHTTWGTGRDAVTEFSAFYRGTPDASFQPTLATYLVRGRPATILDIGFDGPDPMVGFSWIDGGCAWTVHLGSGSTRGDAVDYAARF